MRPAGWLSLIFFLCPVVAGVAEQQQQRDDRSFFLKGLDPEGDNWLALKAEPEIRGKRIAKLGPETLLHVVLTRGPWSKVVTERGEQGWVLSRFLACCRAAPTPGAPATPPLTSPGTTKDGTRPHAAAWTITNEMKQGARHFEASLNDDEGASAVLFTCSGGNLHTFFMAPFKGDTEAKAYDVHMTIGDERVNARATLVKLEGSAGIFEFQDRSPVMHLARKDSWTFELTIDAPGARAEARFMATNTRTAARQALSCGNG